MVSGVLTLAERNVRSIMTRRSNVSWVDLDESPDVICQKLLSTPHGMFPVCRGSLDNIVGVARAKDLLGAILDGEDIQASGALREAHFVPERSSTMKLIDQLRSARGQLTLVSDEYGMLTGVVTPIDVLEAIAGEFPDEDEGLDIQPNGPDAWTVSGSADIHLLEQVLETDGLVSDENEYTSVGGFVLSRFGKMPAVNDSFEDQGIEFKVLETDGKRITSMAVVRRDEDETRPSGR